MALFDPKKLEEIVEKVNQSLPPLPAQLQVLKEDLSQNVKQTLVQALAKLDLVTREEFDVQTKVLAKTRAKLEELEQRLAEMEARMKE